MQQRFATGEIIFRQGDQSNVAYIIVSGKVEIFRELSGSPRQRVAVLEAGQMFGEMGVLDHAPRNAGARALADTIVQAVTIEDE